MTTSTLIALAFAVLATAAWRRRPVAARIHLAAATAFALAALAGDAPGGAPRDGLGYVVAAAGGRPRRIALTGIESLTPSERRVADMAATGLTTRQVADELFVTPKTVEFHLRHVYRKLEINSRDQLVELLGEQAEAS